MHDTRSGSGAREPGVTRTAFAIGTVGRIGEELINGLLESPAYAAVHVAVETPLRSMLPRLRPWHVSKETLHDPAADPGRTFPFADDMYCCIGGARSYFRRDQAYLPLSAEQIPAAARLAADRGARRFVLISPLSAFLQLSAPTAGALHVREIDLVALGFETVIVVRPTAGYAAVNGNALERLIAWGARAVMEIVIPQRLQPMRARHIAQAAILAANSLGPGVHILGADRLADLADPEPSGPARINDKT